MADVKFKAGQGVWARFGSQMYPALIESVPEDPAGKYLVSYFPDLNSRSYVKPNHLWDYEDCREKFASDRTFTRRKDWRQLMSTADKHLGITAEIPETRTSTRASNSEMHSETVSDISTGQMNSAKASSVSDDAEAKARNATPPKSPHVPEAIELPDEDAQADVFEFSEEGRKSPKRRRMASSPAVGSAEVAKSKSADKGGSKRRRVEATKKADAESEKAASPVIGSRRNKVPSSNSRTGNGMPEKESLNRSQLSNGFMSDPDAQSPRKSPRASRNNQKPSPVISPDERQKSAKSKSRTSLPPVCASASGNSAFAEAFGSVHRSISSSELADMPKVLHPGKQHDVKAQRSLENSNGQSLMYGFIGLNSLSLIIVRHLSSFGKVAYVWDSNNKLVKQAGGLGAYPCDSKEKVIEASDVIFTSLLTEEDAHEAFFTPVDGICACIAAPKGVVDIGTPNVAYVRQINELLTARRVAYLYCAVFGNVVDAADAKLSFCVAGSSRLYKDVAELLRSLGGTYEAAGHWTDPTMALKAKSVCDMLVAAENLAFCEALGMSSRLGLPADFMLKVMRHQTKDHFSQCLPAEASQIGSDDQQASSKKSAAGNDLCLLPYSLSATAAMSPDSRRGQSVESLRSLTCPVNYVAAFAKCFSSLASGSGVSTNSLFVAMHSILTANASGHGSEDVSALFQRLSSLI